MKQTVLLVEDDVWLGELYKVTLEAETNITVRWVKTAEAALDCLEELKPPNLIVLDLFLPHYNGIEFLHELASYEALHEVPVLILSSVPFHELGITLERLKHYGVAGYLYKPTTKPDQLLVAVKKQLLVGNVLL